jgi:hypothetical protein
VAATRAAPRAIRQRVWITSHPRHGRLHGRRGLARSRLAPPRSHALPPARTVRALRTADRVPHV